MLAQLIFFTAPSYGFLILGIVLILLYKKGLIRRKNKESVLPTAVMVGGILSLVLGILILLAGMLLVIGISFLDML